MIGYARIVSNEFKQAGGEVVRHRTGSHTVWKMPNNDRTVSIPLRLNDRNLAKRIMKEAGLPANKIS